MYRFTKKFVWFVCSLVVMLLGGVQHSHALSAFCAANPVGSPGQVVNLAQFGFTTQFIALDQNETLHFAITQMNGNPASLPRVRITAPFALVPGGQVFDQPIPAGATLQAMIQETRNIATTNISISLLGTGVPGSGVPVSAAIVITCTPAPATTVPTVTGITPNSGPVAGGTAAVITGTDFGGATAVTIGGTAVTSFTVNSGTSINVVTPAGTAGPASVEVTTSAGTSAANTLFTYAPPSTTAPTVTGVTPNSGPTAGGTAIVVTGTDFTGATAVTIGGVPVTSFTVTSPTSINVVTPAGSFGAASVEVTTPAGTNAANALFSYFFGPALPPLTPSVELSKETQNAVANSFARNASELNRMTSELSNLLIEEDEVLRDSEVSSFEGEFSRFFATERLKGDESRLDKDEAELKKAKADLKKQQETLKEGTERLEALRQTDVSDVRRFERLQQSIQNSYSEERIERLQEKIERLEAKIDQAAAEVEAERKRLGLPPRVHSVIQETRGQVALSFVEEEKIQNRIDEAFPQQTFALASSGNGVEFSLQSDATRDNSKRFWIQGAYSIIDDDSVARRDGYKARVAVGTAECISERMAASFEVSAVNGAYDIAATNAQNDIVGIGVAAGIAVRLGQLSTAQVTAYYDHSWIDTNIAGVTGSYTNDAFGVTASLTRSFRHEDILFRSGVSAGYTYTSLGGYTNSAGTVIPGSDESDGNISANLRAQRTFAASEIDFENIATWTPFVEASVSHYFSRQDTFNFGPGLTVTDGDTNGSLQFGTDIIFSNGGVLNLSGLFSTNFGGDLMTYGGTARLTIPF